MCRTLLHWAVNLLFVTSHFLRNALYNYPLLLKTIRSWSNNASCTRVRPDIFCTEHPNNVPSFCLKLEEGRRLRREVSVCNARVLHYHYSSTHHTAHCLVSEWNDVTGYGSQPSALLYCSKKYWHVFRLYIYTSIMLGDQAYCRTMPQSPWVFWTVCATWNIVRGWTK